MSAVAYPEDPSEDELFKRLADEMDGETGDDMTDADWAVG